MEQLVELRDGLAVAKNFAVAAYMASMSLAPTSSERGALSEVTNACRERLEATLFHLDKMLAEARQRTKRRRRGGQS